MYRKTVIIILTLLFSINIYAQLSIEECYDKAKANYPLVKQYDLIDQARDYNLSNVKRGWLPQIQLSAKASYQSDVTKIPIDFSEVPIPQLADLKMPELSKDQYGVSIDVSQILWDGGMLGAKRQRVIVSAEAEKAELEVNLYALRERVNQLFFGILMCDALLEQNRLLQDELQRNYEQVAALARGGLTNQADINAVKVEQLKATQHFTTIIHNRNALLQMLEAFMGEKFDNNIVLQKPVVESLWFNEIFRPELLLFNSKLMLINTFNCEIKADLMPKFGLFLTGGYGNPGLNMLKNGFSAYYIGGLRLSWNIGSFYTLNNRKNQIITNRNSIEIQRETFLFNTAISQSNQENEIAKFRELMQSDEEIIALRNFVKHATESKVVNGTASISDLLRDVNAETLAKQEKVFHELEMLQAIYNLKFITNN